MASPFIESTNFDMASLVKGKKEIGRLVEAAKKVNLYMFLTPLTGRVGVWEIFGGVASQSCSPGAAWSWPISDVLHVSFSCQI